MRSSLTRILVLGSIALSSLTFAQSNVVVTVFNFPNLNGSVGSCSNENENLIEIIDALPGYSVNGSAIVNFTNTTALQTALDNAQFFFMTDMEGQDPNSTAFFPVAAQTILHDFVFDGGVMVMTGTYNARDNDFLNKVFNWDLAYVTSSSSSTWSKVSANTAGTPFDDVTVSSLPWRSATDAIGKGTVPNFTTMFGTDNNAVVAVIEYGSGYVIFLGYDFYNTGLNPSISSPCPAYSTEWVQQVLPAALAYATQLSSSSVSNLTETTGDFIYNFSENATTYYIVVDASASAPTAAQIKAGVSYASNTIINSGSASTIAGTDYTFGLTGLSACSDYKIYAVSEWNDAGTLTFSSIETGVFSTIDQTAPTLILQDLSRTLTNTSGLIVPASDFISSFIDGCSSTYTITSSDLTFTCSDIGTQSISVTVEDESGNSVTETANITITNGLTSTLSIVNSLCTATPMYWASWNNVTSTSGTGTFTGLGVTVDVTHSQGGLSTTSTMFGHSTFPTSYNVPNTTTLRNDLAGTFTFCFSQPIENPQIAFSSIGNPSTPVPITTSVPYQVVWNGQAVTYTSNTAFTGNEGYTIISFPGTHECITLTYSANETYANLAFGFENFNCDNPTVCAGDAITLTASGGTGYTWTPSATLNASNTASVTATPSATTTYSVIDPNNACSVPQTVTITVPVPTAPTATSPQAYCPGSTVSDLVASAPTGMGVLWYTTSSGGTALPSSTVLVDGTTYYAETNDLTCGPSSTRTPVVFNQTAALAQTSSGAASIVRGFPAAVDNQVVINETNNISDAIVFISSGFVTGDVLDYTGTLPSGVTKSYNNTSGVLTFSGTMTPSELETIFRGVTMNTTSFNGQNREVTFNIGSALPNSDNGHYYEFITNSGISWTAAKSAAEALTYYGLQGYLVTVTSETENAFVSSKLTGQGWMGASDATTEGYWFWVTGPESGQQFWTGTSTGSAFGGRYNKWDSGEPNNAGNEDYAHFLSNGEWNDYPVSLSNINGYVVEFGGSTGDPCVALSSSKTVNVTISVLPTVSTTTPAISFTNTTASVEGALTNDGNATVTERGLVFSTSVNPTTSTGTKITNSSTAIGSFTESLSGLAPNTTYYVRAFATNSVGTSYGNEISFTTTPTAPAAITTNFDDATFGGSIICNGDAVTLTTSSTTAGTITWYSGGCGTGTALGTGATLTVSPTSTTTYYARVENSTTGLNSTCVSATVTVQSASPTITYSSSYYLYYSAETISANSLTVSTTGAQGYVSSYSISPTLPGGLTFNTSNGQISGTPTNGFPRTTYTVTGNTPCGNISTTLEIEILECSGLDVNDFTLRGSAAVLGSGASTEFKLTDATNGQFGAVWNQTRLDLTKDFDINSQVYLGNKNGADGIAFVLQPLSTNQGSTGGGLGYAGINPSFAVEFDTYQNSADIASDHIAFMENGNTANHYGTYSVEMEDGAWRSVRFKWEASSKTMRVYLNGTQIISRTNYDIVANLFSNNPYVYWGFTGATGGQNNLQKVKFDRYCLTLAANTVANLTTTNPVVSNTSTSASVEGTLVNDGGSPVTERGIVMNTSTAPTTTNLKVVDASTAIGSYTNLFTGLIPSTLYYARSYAINGMGTGYGNEITFYTAPIDVAAITSTDYDATSGYDVICYGASTTLTATTPDGVVQWYDDAALTNLIGTGNSITVSPTSTTTYYARNLNNGLYSDNTASLNVTVRPQLVAPVISGAETVCWNSRPNALTGVAATGGSSAAGTAPGFSYQWEESIDGGTTWTAITGATNYATYQPSYLYQTTHYRLLATDLGSPSCYTDLASNVIEITVRDPFTPSVVSTNGVANTFCDGGAVTLSATATTGGSGPAFYYQWQSSADSVSWSNIGPLLNNTTTYTATGLTSDTHYRIIAFDQGTPACGSVYSLNTVKAISQDPVTEGSISGAQHICSQTAPSAPIANVAVGTGRGTISYRWEESTDGGTTWTTIAGATGDSYQPGVLLVTTKYRRFAISTLNGQNCESTLASNEVEVTVDQLPVATMTTTSDVTCVDAAYTLAGVNSQYGTIAWTHDGTGTLANLTGLTPTYTPAATDAGNTVTITLTVTGTTICLSTQAVASLALQVDSLPKATAGGSATICSNATHTISGASARYGTIAWTHDGLGTLTDATTNAPTYAPVAGDAGNTVTLTMTVTSNNQCGTATDVATYTIDVDPLPVATAGGSDIICSLASATVTGASSANGTILWTHNGSGTLSDGTTTAPTYTAGAADAGSTVTLTMTVTSDNTCTPQTAVATYTVTVRPDFVPATFVGQDQDLCYLTAASQITATAATGGTGPYAYQWQESSDMVNWSNVSGATSLTYTPPGILNATKYFRILSTDLGSPGCGTAMSGADDVEILVRNPLTPPVVSNITLCNATSTTIIPIGAKGGRKVFEYQWQQSSNGSTGWMNVGSSSLDSTYTTPTLTTGTTYYRVIARDKDQGTLISCGSTFSSPMLVTIGAQATAGVIAGDETTCTGDVTATITSTTDGTGSGTITYKWEESTDAGTTWTIVSGATAKTYAPGNLTQTTWFRRTTVATLNGQPCESAVSNTVVKTVDQLPTFTATPSNTTVNTDAGLPTAVVAYVATATGPSAVTLTYDFTGATVASGIGTGTGEAFGIGTTTVVITATTNCGAVTTSFDVVVIDNENPTITAGADMAVSTTVATTGCAVPVTVTSPVAADNAPGVAVTYVLSGATTGTGSTIANVSFNVGTTTITWTATDASGNTATATQDVVVTDAVLPVIAGMPADMSLTADAGLCTTTATWTAPTATDECGISTFTSDAASGDAFPVGTTTVTYTATDVNGNVTTASFDVTVVDSELPVIAGMPADIALTSDVNACGATATWVAPTSSDNCGVSTFVSTHASGDFFAVGTTIVTYTATDVNGNVSTGSFNVVVADLNPVITGTPTDITVNNDAGDCSAVVTWTAPTVSDNCAGVVMVSTHASGDVFAVGTTTVTYTATDNNGNITTSSFDITVLDAENPVFVSAPSDITVSSTATTCDAAVTWTAPVVSDNCTVAPTVTSTHASGDVFPVGTTTVTYTVVDTDGNSSTHSFDVTVEDNTAPIIASVTDITVSVDAASCSSANPGVVVPLASDNCDASVTVSGVRSDALLLTDAYPLGTTVITWSAMDAAGNAATSLVQNVTVNDTIAPYITTQLADTFYVDENSCVFYIEAWRDSLVYSDNCGGVATLTSTRPANLFLNKGMHIIKYTLSDANGNSRVYNHKVHVVDTISPWLLNMPTNLTAYAGASSCGTTVAWTPPTASDNCVGFVLTGTAKSGDYFNIGTTTVVYTLVDAVGLSIQDSFDITVIDTISPVISSKNATAVLDASGNASITLSDVISSATTDNCGLTSVVLDVTAFDCSDLGANTVTITATDVNGNVSTATATVTVVDNAAPTVVAQNATLYLDATGSATLAVSDVHSSSADNCGVTGTTINTSTFGCSDLGANTVTVTSVDASGNAGTATATVTVMDTITPVLTVPSAAIVAYAPSNSCGASVYFSGVSGTDNCTAPTLTYDYTSGATFNVGTTTVTATATDASGNAVSATFDVTVLDTISPVIVGTPTTVTIVPDPNNCSSTVSWSMPSATDNCSATLTASAVSGSTFNVGTHTVTFTATDLSGNTSTSVLTFTVTDVINPVLTNVPSDTTMYSDVNTCGAVLTWPTIVGTDNCSNVTVATSVANGATFNVGQTVVTVSGTDAAGNTVQGAFTVTVVDTVSPTWVYVPSNIVSGNCSSAVSYAAPTASDNCSGVTVVQTAGLPSGSTFPVGVTTNTFVATDASGNTSTVSFTVNINVTTVTYTPPVTTICVNDPSVDLSDPNYTLTFVGAGVNGTMFNPSTAGVGVHAVQYNFTDSLGCIVSGTFSILVNQAPIKPSIVRLSSVVLTLNNNYPSYQWYRNGVKIPGATSQTYTVTQAGEYSCRVSNGSCYEWSDAFAFGMGIDDLEKGTYLVYPNPSQGSFQVVHGFETKDMQVIVVNMLGQTIYQSVEQEAVITIDLQHAPQGSYILIMRNEETEVHQPIKIQR